MLGTNDAGATEGIDQGIEGRIPGQLKFGPGLQGGMDHGNRCVCRTGTVKAGHGARDDAHQCSTVGRGEQLDLVSGDVLIAGADHLVLGRKIHP